MTARKLGLGAIGLAYLLSGPILHAADAGVRGGHLDDVVAHVGPVSITVGEVERSLAVLPRFQRASWGPTAAAIREHFVSEVVVPNALLSLAADAQKIEAEPPVSYAVERARAYATVRAIRSRLGGAGAISQDEVHAYYAQNRARYEAPPRYQIWRILCKTREDAQSVLDAALRNPTPKTFTDLARDHSQDKGTYFRAGNLGFVTADGVSVEPGLRADPAVMTAALSVHDGEIVPAPVPEGDYFSVVWRRVTVVAPKRSADEVDAEIRDTLSKARIKTETDELLKKLRTAKVRDIDDVPIEAISLPPVGGKKNEGGTSPSL